MSTRAEAPLEDALALLIRERLTGQAPPTSTKGLVDVWRPVIESRGGKLLNKLEGLSEHQELFGRQIRDLLKVLEMVDQSDQPSPTRTKKRATRVRPRAAPKTPKIKAKRRRKVRTRRARSSFQRATFPKPRETMESGQTEPQDLDEGDIDDETPAPWRPNMTVLDNPEAFGYKVFTRAYDEEVGAISCRRLKNSRLFAPSSTRN